MDTELVLEQRLLHENATLYTGSVDVTGTSRGHAVTGYGWLDLFHGSAA
jgi:hypothetical protein